MRRVKPVPFRGDETWRLRETGRTGITISSFPCSAAYPAQRVWVNLSGPMPASRQSETAGCKEPRVTRPSGAFWRAKLRSAVPSVLFFFASLAVIAFCYSGRTLADGPSITLTSNVSVLQCLQGIGNQTCYYPVTPGMVLPLAGSGFSGSDTTITFSGLPSDVNPTEPPCNVTNGSFTCNYVVPDVPTVQESRYSLTATGNSGDSATLLVGIGPGVGIYPTSGPPGSVVTVYGDNYIGQKSIVFDSTTAITFGTQEPSGLTGTGPSVVYNNVPAQHTCVPGNDGSLSDFGPCTFAVPPYIPGYYNVGVLVALDYSVPDPLACGSAWCVSEFRITPPAISVSPPETLPGSTVQVTGSSFAGNDTSASIFLDGNPVTPSGGCPITQSSSGGTLSCTITVPSSDTAPGPHYIVATGIQYGDSGTGSFDLPGPYPLSPSSLQATPGGTVTVQGIAYDLSDTSAIIDLGGGGGTSNCPISYGSFNCPITIPSTMAAGNYTLEISGSPAGDYDTASLAVIPSLAINPPSASVGTQVTLNSLGFRGSTASATLNGQSLPLILESGGQTTPGTTCPVASNSFPPSGGSCHFTVPTTALPGANTLVLTDNLGENVSSTFTLTPSISLSQSQVSIGQTITVTGYGFPAIEIDGFEIGGIITYADPGSCVPTAAGTISCSFVIPDRGPGTYTFSADALEGSEGDQPLASTSITIVPSISITNNAEGVLPDNTVPAGTALGLNVNGLYGGELYAQVWLDDQLLPQLEGLCVQNPSNGLGTVSLFCTVQLPNVTPGPHILKAVGEAYGEAATTTLYISGVALSPTTGPGSTLLDVRGYGLYLADTSASLTIGGVSPSSVTDANTQQTGCSVTSGTFDCQFATPPLAGGAQTVVATGTLGDQASASFTVVPNLSVLTPSGTIDTQVALEGNGFLSSDTILTISFNGQNVGTCVPSSGAFNCTAFSVPSLAPGTYAIGVVGNSGNPMDIATANYTVIAAPLTITANSASSVYGQAFPAFTAAYAGFINGDTPAALQGTLAITTTAVPTSPVGSYPLTPGGVSSPNYVINFVNGTLTITQAGTSVRLSTSAKGPVADGAQVTLTANVVSATTGTPTGTVTFRSGSTTIGSATLSQGKATLETNTLPPGINDITAEYGGDTNFTSSTSAMETLSVNAPDYTVSASPSRLSLAAGLSGSTILTVVPEGYSGTVTFSCGTVPSNISCSFDPASGSVTIPTGSTTAQTVTLTVSVVSSAAQERRRGSAMVAAILTSFVMAGCLPIVIRKRNLVRSCLLFVALSIVLGAGLAGCASGGGSMSSGQTNPPPPPPNSGSQNVTLTVTAAGSSSSGAISHQVQVTIQITN